jgi:tryptophan 2,3-dioxygenase
MADEQQSTPYYSDYLQLDRILNSQDLRSVLAGQPADDEMLFIIVHQAYELWFKQIIFELDLVLKIFRAKVNDNSPDMSNAVHRLKRINKILDLLNKQFDILESMTSLDFLDFRNLLVPASGFQSKQFRIIEASLGLTAGQRYMASYYKHPGKGGFSSTDIEDIGAVESNVTLKNEIIEWLYRTPFFADTYWEDYEAGDSKVKGVDAFWLDYREIYAASLSENERNNAEAFDVVFLDAGVRDFSARAMKAVLFIMLYRDFPLLHLPFHLLNTLTELDELLSSWRHRHAVMVNRMIGSRVGTGGTKGAGYLQGTLAPESNIFQEITSVSTFLIQRAKLPSLPTKLTEKLGFTP